MSDKPVWLLDIDGVLNVMHPPALSDFDTWHETLLLTHVAWAEGLRKLPLCVADEVVQFINKAHESGLVEIRWHTTWQQNANEFADLFGLPNLPVHPAAEFHPAEASVIHTTRWWKKPGAFRVVEQEKRALLWTDDDLNYGLGVDERRSLLRAGGLMICPNSRVGLRRSHLDLIWARLGGEA